MKDMKNLFGFMVYLFSLIGMFLWCKTSCACSFPDAPDYSAPEWICNDLVKVDGYPIIAVGSRPYSQAGPSFTRNSAIADARENLAARIRTIAAREIRRFIATTGTGVDETVDAAEDQTGITFSYAILENTPVIDLVVSPNRVMYVLIGMDKVTAQKIIKRIVKSSFENNKAEYQRKLGKERWKEVQKKIDRYEDNPNFFNEERFHKAKEDNKLQDSPEVKKSKEK